MKEELHFEVDSRLLLELGERLVARRSTALAELIKNAYDADASEVSISFESVLKPGGKIVVADDGAGMPFETLRDAWMTVATGFKSAAPTSEIYKRPRTGSKGVGRFASRFLADGLTIESVADRGKARERTRVVIDWLKFTPGRSISSVPITCEREAVGRDTPTGVKLILSPLREAWTKDDISDIRYELLSLVSPFKEIAESSEDPGFNIILEAPELDAKRETLAGDFLKAAWAELTGEVDTSGKLVLKTKLPRIEEKDRFVPKDRFPNAGPFSFTIRYFVWKRDQFAGLDIGVKDAQNVGKREGGVRVYIDRFRVLPYGEPGDDWLSLDADRGRRLTTFKLLTASEDDPERPALFLPGNNQLFGGVSLSRNRNPDIIPTITRTSLVENKAFADVKNAVRLAVERITLLYARETAADREKKKRSQPKTEDPIKDLSDIIQQLERSPQVAAATPKRMADALASVKERISQEREERINEASMLRVLATTGSLVAIFDHELRALTEDVRTIGRTLSALIPKLPRPQRDQVEEAAKELAEWVETIEDYGLQLSVLLSKDSRTKRRSLPLRPLVDEAVKPFRRHMRDSGIQFENEVAPDLRLPAMYRSEIHSILINLLTNSMKAVKERKVRKIVVRGRRRGQKVSVRVLDTGPGIVAARREEVFMPFVSDSQPDPVLGTGTGLGLKITRDILDAYGGKIHFEDPPEGWGASAVIELEAP